jgi:hypothetical protein
MEQKLKHTFNEKKIRTKRKFKPIKINKKYMKDISGVSESWIHTAVHGLYFSRNQGIMGSRIFCDAICSIHMGHIFSTVWFNHRTVSESVRT